MWAVSRDDRNFHNASSYSPQRWLPSTHPLHDENFKDDNLRALFAFSVGPRSCIGKEMAWMHGRQFFARLLWTFDLHLVEGQDINLDRDLVHFGFFKKPDVYVRFIPVDRS